MAADVFTKSSFTSKDKWDHAMDMINHCKVKTSGTEFHPTDVVTGQIQSTPKGTKIPLPNKRRDTNGQWLPSNNDKRASKQIGVTDDADITGNPQTDGSQRLIEGETVLKGQHLHFD